MDTLDALYVLNRRVEDWGKTTQERSLIYGLKNIWMRWLHENGYTVIVGQEPYESRGRSLALFSFTYHVSGRSFKWHIPSNLAPWLGAFQPKERNALPSYSDTVADAVPYDLKGDYLATVALGLFWRGRLSWHESKIILIAARDFKRSRKGVMATLA